MNIRYLGTRTAHGCIVWVEESPSEHWPKGRLLRVLPPRHDVRNHSPDGFEWGYGGSGPAQLSLALAIDALGGDVSRAGRVYQLLKVRFVGNITTDHWRADREAIRALVLDIERENPDL